MIVYIVSFGEIFFQCGSMDYIEKVFDSQRKAIAYLHESGFSIKDDGNPLEDCWGHADNRYRFAFITVKVVE